MFIDIRLHDRGPVVVSLQVLLNRYSRRGDLVTDGIFGPLTADAVRQVQAQLNTTTSGNVDQMLWEALCSRAGVQSFANNDIYDYRHEQATPDSVRSCGWFATGGMSGGVGQVVSNVRGAAPGPGTVVLLRLYGHGASGIQGVTGGSNAATNPDGRVICEVQFDGRTLRGEVYHAGEFSEAYNVCRVETAPGIFQNFPHGRYTTLGMDGIPNRAAIATENFSEVRDELSQLRPLFTRYGTAELHGCRVGSGARGRSFLGHLAELWNVPVTAGILQQTFGPAALSRFEGPTYTAFPNRDSLHTWSSRFR